MYRRYQSPDTPITLNINITPSLTTTFSLIHPTEWFFSFGFVMPNSTNSWQQTIDAAAAEDMLTAEALSGNVVFETSFYDGDEFMCKNSVRIYYV